MKVKKLALIIHTQMLYYSPTKQYYAYINITIHWNNVLVQYGDLRIQKYYVLIQKVRNTKSFSFSNFLSKTNKFATYINYPASLLLLLLLPLSFHFLFFYLIFFTSRLHNAYCRLP